jgi:hypothetical protein
MPLCVMRPDAASWSAAAPTDLEGARYACTPAHGSGRCGGRGHHRSRDRRSARSLGAASLENRLPQPLQQDQDHRLHGAAQRRPESVRRLRHQAQHRTPARRQRSGQQLQQLEKPAGHWQDDRADQPRWPPVALRPDQPPQAAGQMPRRRGSYHRARGTARRLGRRWQHAVQERKRGYRQGRLPDRAEQQGPGQGDDQRSRQSTDPGTRRRS